MVKFSETLEENGKEDLTELDNMLDQKDVTVIIEEKELFEFLDKLPEKWESYKGRIEIFLRTRNIIGYTNMDYMKAILCYVPIKDLLRPSEVRKMDSYFSLKPVNIVAICKGLGKLAVKNPDKGIYIMSLLNYLSENGPAEEESPSVTVP
jgi:hypothetical protein